MKKEAVGRTLLVFVLIFILTVSPTLVIAPHNPNHNPGGGGAGGGGGGADPAPAAESGGGTTKTIQVIPEYPKE